MPRARSRQSGRLHRNWLARKKRWRAYGESGFVVSGHVALNQVVVFLEIIGELLFELFDPLLLERRGRFAIREAEPTRHTFELPMEVRQLVDVVFGDVVLDFRPVDFILEVFELFSEQPRLGEERAITRLIVLASALDGPLESGDLFLHTVQPVERFI